MRVAALQGGPAEDEGVGEMTVEGTIELPLDEGLHLEAVLTERGGEPAIEILVDAAPAHPASPRPTEPEGTLEEPRSARRRGAQARLDEPAIGGEDRAVEVLAERRREAAMVRFPNHLEGGR